MVQAEISIKLIFLPKRKESSVPLLVVQIHFMAPMVCLRAFIVYTFIILCELRMRVTIVAKLVQISY